MGRNESTPRLLRPGMIASNMAAPAALRFTFPSFNALHTSTGAQLHNWSAFEILGDKRPPT